MKICDSHTDFLTELTEEEIDKYIKLIKNKIKIISSAIFTTKNNLIIQKEKLNNTKSNFFKNKKYNKYITNFKYIKNHNKFSKNNKNNKKINKNIENINKINGKIKILNKKYKIKLILSIEDLGFINNKKDLLSLIKLKPFSTTLTWNEDNQYAGGSNSQIGLTKLGIKTVKLLERHSILVDTAHLSRQGFFDLKDITKYPIYNSHSNVYSLYPHNRNLTDEQIKAIIDSNGYMGITFYRNFITDKQEFTAKDIVLQFDYLIKNFGYKNFGLGTDLFGIDKNDLSTNIRNYFEINNLIIELKKLKYKNKIIKHIIYKNFENFIKNTKKLIKNNKKSLKN